MSHWHRLPRASSVKALLLRSKLRFILDRGFSVKLAAYFPEGTHSPYSLGLAQQPSSQEVLKLCQEKHGILVTANAEYASLLSLDRKTSWGVLLLPNNEAVQLDIVRRLFVGNLVFRPSVERIAMLEYARRNRLLLDMRHDQPILSVFCDCRWLS